MGKYRIIFKCIVLILDLILICNSAEAQYYTSYCEADSAREMGNYELALELYKKKVASGDKFSKMFYEYYIYEIACCYAVLKQNDSAFYYLNKAIDAGEDKAYVFF